MTVTSREKSIRSEIEYLYRKLDEERYYNNPLDPYSLYGYTTKLPIDFTLPKMVYSEPTKKETPVTAITTKTVTTTVKSLEGVHLEIHENGSIDLKGFSDDKGQSVTVRVWNKTPLKSLYKLVGELLLEGK